MIQATFFKDSEGNYKGFSLLGHAGYDEAGKDIVCASVSILAISTVNSIEQITKDDIQYYTDEETGCLTCSFPGKINKGSKLLIDSFLFNLKQLRKDYKKYIKISIKEV
ncbi:MAG: ribosomal-processing cysteine protease Prp [Lachnospiraceae bacterium]|nr:ribosomal-processing cysteine protease Prp [Lachnospiraceae bacterium]